jgi:hypothetical protein
MPDLSKTATQAWLRRIDANEAAATWPPAFRTIEDQNDAPEHWEALGRILDQFGGANPDALDKALRTPRLANTLRTVLAQVGTARVFRFIHWLGEQKVPDSYGVLASLTEGDGPEATALRATVVGFNRRATLNRIFAPERIAALQAATERAMTETSQ